MSKSKRQGDVLLRRVGFLTVPPEAKEDKKGILARGETTGHSHRLTGGAKLFRMPSGQTLVQVEAGQQAALVHEEHGPHRLEEGIYEVVGQREYSPVEERRVTD